jgi:hypothetical protein
MVAAPRRAQSCRRALRDAQHAVLYVNWEFEAGEPFDEICVGPFDALQPAVDVIEREVVAS